MEIILTVGLIGLLLVVNEAWFRLYKQPGELSRKFVHVSVGSFVAFWPFFLSWRQIILLSLAFVLVVGVSKYLHIFRAIHSVQRPTYGELFFGMAVGAVALVTESKGIYAAALLQMSLADGLAAIVGTRYGVDSGYRIFGAHKSVAGTATFFAVSMVLLAGFTVISGIVLSPLHMLLIAMAATAIENVGSYGSDNLLVPLVVAAALTI